MFSAGFTTDLLAPFPGRLSRTLEISIVCALVVIISMTFQIPDPDISAYVIFFAAKENSGLNMLMSLVLTLVVTIVIALSFMLSVQFLDHPEARILVLVAVSFIFFFLATASKLAPLAGTMGLIIAYVLDLLSNSPIGEITTRGLLYAWLFVAMPMATFFAYNIFFGRHPEVLLRSALAERIRYASAALRIRNERSRNHLTASIEGGNAEFLKMLKMIKLLGRQPHEATERLAALITLSYSLVLTVAALGDDPKGPLLFPDEGGHSIEKSTDASDAAQVPRAALKTATRTRADSDVLTRLDKLAATIERLPRVIHPSKFERSAPDPIPPVDLADQIITITELIENAAVEQELPELPHPQTAEKKKAGFFVPDAFTNPDHTRYAGKATAAVLICYLTFNLLDWPGIHTSMITCFIVSLTTVGETTQKLLLRITGCLVGAAFGILTIVYVLPAATSITDVTLLIFFVTLPAAWIAVGKPTVAYIGFQFAFALYLCILQGSEPKFDLTLARDRTIGILFGNAVVYLISTRVFPVSILARLQKEIVLLIDQCRAVLKSISMLASPISTSGQLAELRVSLEGLEKDLASFGYETWRARNGRLQTWAGHLSLKAVRKLIDELTRLAAYPPPVSREGEAAEILYRMSLDIDTQLNVLQQTLSASRGQEPERKSSRELSILAGRLRGADPSLGARIDVFEALENRLNGVFVTLSRYRRLLHAGSGTDG